MPSSAVHITIADEAAQILHVADLPSFLLGSIAPDAVNVNGFAPREVRYKAHLRSRSYDEWKRTIAAFRTEHEAEYTSCPDFFKGVLLHLYTDIAWDELVQPLLFAEFRRRGVPDDDFTDEKWKELDRLDAVLFAEPQYAELLAKLALAEQKPFGEITPKLLGQWRDVILSEKPLTDEKPFFLGKEHIMLTLGRAVGLLERGV